MKVLPERSRHLLSTLVERYIREGEPIGSKTLSSDGSIALSAATIRNIMADLEERGYLASPHTSAGRVPTVKGLRFFIDSLLTSSSLGPAELKALEDRLHPKEGTGNLIEATGSLLSGITQLVGIVSIPRREQQVLRMIEFLPLADQRVLVILVLNEEEVQNRIISTERGYTLRELELAAHYLNTNFAGKDLVEVRTGLLDLLRRERDQLDCLMKAAIDVVDKACEGVVAGNDYILAGENNLFGFRDPFNAQQLRKLFDTFSEKQGVLHLLNECIKANGLQIFIGEEASEHGFEGCSVVTSAYSIDGHVVGALGVIGPTRMPYQKVIPLVDVTAKFLSSALNHTL